MHCKNDKTIFFNATLKTHRDNDYNNLKEKKTIET